MSKEIRKEQGWSRGYQCPKCNYMIIVCKGCNEPFDDFEESDGICLECEPLEGIE